jgi:amino acid transporter
MAVAQVEERQLLKKLRWYDGFVICLANPGFMLGSLGWSVLDMGGWGAALIWGLTAAIIVPVTVIYSELAAMFPHKSGGVSIYANEGWRKYTTLVGPVATFGYWIGWSVVLSFIGLFTGYIAQAAWFPGEPYGTYAFGGAKLDDGYFSTGPVNIGLQHLIAIGLILAVWVFNFFGTRCRSTTSRASCSCSRSSASRCCRSSTGTSIPRTSRTSSTTRAWPGAAGSSRSSGSGS